MMNDDDACMLVPAREDVLARLHRMLDPTVLESPTTADLDAVLWLNQAHQFCSHAGRVGRMQAVPVSGMSLRLLMVPYEMPSPLWLRYFADRHHHPAYRILLEALKLDEQFVPT